MIRTFHHTRYHWDPLVGTGANPEFPLGDADTFIDVSERLNARRNFGMSLKEAAHHGKSFPQNLSSRSRYEDNVSNPGVAEHWEGYDPSYSSTHNSWDDWKDSIADDFDAQQEDTYDDDDFGKDSDDSVVKANDENAVLIEADLSNETMERKTPGKESAKATLIDAVAKTTSTVTTCSNNDYQVDTESRPRETQLNTKVPQQVEQASLDTAQGEPEKLLCMNLEQENGDADNIANRDCIIDRQRVSRRPQPPVVESTLKKPVVPRFCKNSDARAIAKLAATYQFDPQQTTSRESNTLQPPGPSSDDVTDEKFWAHVEEPHKVSDVVARVHALAALDPTSTTALADLEVAGEQHCAASYSSEEFVVDRLQATNAQLRQQLEQFKEVLCKSLNAEAPMPSSRSGTSPKRRPLVSPFCDAVAVKQLELAHRKLRAYGRENRKLRLQVVALTESDGKTANLAERCQQLERSVTELREENRSLHNVQRTQAKALTATEYDVPQMVQRLEAQLKIATEQRRRAESERAASQKRETQVRSKLLKATTFSPTPITEEPSTTETHFNDSQDKAHVETLRIALDRHQMRLARAQADARRRKEADKAEIKRLELLVEKRNKDLRMQQLAINELKKNLIKLNERHHKIKDASMLPPRQGSKVLATLRRPSSVPDSLPEDDSGVSLKAGAVLSYGIDGSAKPRVPDLPVRIRQAASPRTTKLRRRGK